MTVIFKCPKPATPSGGCYIIHKYASLLNELGIESIVWTPEPFDLWWSANPVKPNLIRTQVDITSKDILIVPEVNWILERPQDYRQVMFLQNFQWFDPNANAFRPKEILVVSRHLANWVERIMGYKALGKATPYLEEGVWQVTEKQKDRVLLMTRRNTDWARMAELLNENGFTPEIVEEPLTQRQLSECFSRCEYYLHLVYPEGFPMITIEAMRSGTLVIGTTGGGGVEAQHHLETAIVVQDPESGQYYSHETFCQRIMEQLLIIRNDEENKKRIRETAMEWGKRYTAEATKAELKAIFGV